jgi:hypothetical protein
LSVAAAAACTHDRGRFHGEIQSEQAGDPRPHALRDSYYYNIESRSCKPVCFML